MKVVKFKRDRNLALILHAKAYRYNRALRCAPGIRNLLTVRPLAILRSDPSASLRAGD